MRTKRLPLAVALLAASAGSLAETFDARSMARGGAGLTMGEYNQVLTNPALINQFDENDEFSFALNAGAFASDKDGMLGDVDDVQDDLDDLEACAGSGSSACQNQASALDQSLSSLNGKIVQIGAGGAVVFALPNRTLPVALVARMSGDAGTRFIYDSNDQQILQDIANGTPNASTGGTVPTTDDLQSELEATAVSLTEIGLNFGHEISGFQLGALVKSQKIELIKYIENVNNFEASDIVDDEQNTEEHSAFNIDLGLRKVFGANDQYVWGATIENLIPQDFDGPNGSDYEMDPVLTGAIGYRSSWVKVEASYDFTERPGFDLLEERQYARVGAEFSAGRHFHIRAGYQEDLKNNVSSMTTAGIGITPWDRANIDLAAQIGEGDTYGVALQLGFKI